MSVTRERYEVGDKVKINIGDEDEPRWIPAEITETDPQLDEPLLLKATYKGIGLKKAIATISEDSDVFAGSEAEVVNDRLNRRDIRPR